MNNFKTSVFNKFKTGDYISYNNVVAIVGNSENVFACGYFEDEDTLIADGTDYFYDYSKENDINYASESQINHMNDLLSEYEMTFYPEYGVCIRDDVYNASEWDVLYLDGSETDFLIVKSVKIKTEPSFKFIVNCHLYVEYNHWSHQKDSATIDYETYFDSDLIGGVIYGGYADDKVLEDLQVERIDNKLHKISIDDSEDVEDSEYDDYDEDKKYILYEVSYSYHHRSYYNYDDYDDYYDYHRPDYTDIRNYWNQYKDNFCNNKIHNVSSAIRWYLKHIKDDYKLKIIACLLDAEINSIKAKVDSNRNLYETKHGNIKKTVLLFKEHSLVYGRQDSEAIGVNDIVYFELDDGTLISFHDNLDYDVNEYKGKWDGLKNSTLGKLQKYISENFNIDEIMKKYENKTI